LKLARGEPFGVAMAKKLTKTQERLLEWVETLNRRGFTGGMPMTNTLEENAGRRLIEDGYVFYVESRELGGGYVSERVLPELPEFRARLLAQVLEEGKRLQSRIQEFESLQLANTKAAAKLGAFSSKG
jgi:hypothetical protein